MHEDTPTRTLPPEPQHFAFVDSLRGIAILGVMMVHAAQQAPSASPRLREFTDAGKYGVQLFFVVSAFTLFWSLRSRSTSDRKPLAAFYVRRIFRIGPLFWIAAIVYPLVRGTAPDVFAPNGTGIPHVVATLLFLHGWYPTTTNSVVPGGWSIGAEFMFYCCIPMLFHRLKSLDSTIRLAVVTMLLWKFLHPVLTIALDRQFPQSWRFLIHEFLYYSFPSQFPVFCLGIALYFLIEGAKASLSATTLLLIAAAVVLGVPDHIQFAAAFVALALGLRFKHIAILVNPVTRFVGKVSYSAYIWHFWVLLRIAPRIIPLVHLRSVSESTVGALQVAVLYLSTVALTLVAAAASFYAIELPGQWLGKRLIANLGWGRSKITDAKMPDTAPPGNIAQIRRT